MKTNFLKFSILLFFAAMLYACSDEQLKPNDNQDTEAAEGIIATRGKLDKTFLELGVALAENEGTFGGGRTAFNFMNKGRAARLAEDWGGCALFSFTENADGSWTIKFDYGTGCNDGDMFKKGIVTLTGKSTGDLSGYYKVAFENFSEKKAGDQNQNPGSMTGFYESTWTAEEIPLEDTTDMRRDEAIKVELVVKYQGGTKDTFNATGEISSTMEGSEVTSYAFSGSTAGGDVFSGNVVEPLFFSFRCTETSIYVEGTEAVEVNGKSYVIDYGNGVCDNIFTITTDGVVVTVDLDETGG